MRNINLPKTKVFLRADACISFVLLLAACDRPKPPPTKFQAGDIVRVKLTGERLGVVRLTNRILVYDERYDVRNHEGYVREMLPHELERDE
jgi:hypothetical protein